MRSRNKIGWLIGVLCAAVAVSVGEVVAAFVRPASAPLIAVGNRLITLTPSYVERSATQSVGTNDKTYLFFGIFVLLAAVGAFVGELAQARLRNGLIGVGLIGAFGVYCALTANASEFTDVIPTVVGTAASMVALVLLVRLAKPRKLSKREPKTMVPPLADRRLFMQGAAATAALAAVTGFGGRAAQHANYDVAADRAKVTLPPPRSGATTMPRGVDLGKSGVAWQTPNSSFYRIDTALAVPQINTADWQLRIHGKVDHPMTISWKQLLKRPLVDRWITMSCVSNEVGGNLVSNALFRGALLADLLREAGVHRDCDQLLMSSQDGMTIGAPTKVVMDGRSSLLAVGMNGTPLPIEHGFPVRVVVPGLYGYVSACKWIVDINCTTFGATEAYWVAGGWAAQPKIKIASRIDRPSSAQNVNVGETVAIAGVAWDQHVGVAKVEVQINDGPWNTARLAAAPSTDTWRQWVYPWKPDKSGSYRLTVRATDANGTVQTTEHREPFPSGATGLHSVTVHALI